jgi:integrase
LSDTAFAIVKDAMTNKSDRLFHDVGSNSFAKCVQRARWGIAHFTTHDLRRTAVTKMAELGVSPIVMASVINHRSVTKAGVTLAVYSQYDYGKEKREALELWAERLSAIVSGAAPKIISMQRGAAG